MVNPHVLRSFSHKKTSQSRRDTCHIGQGNGQTNSRQFQLTSVSYDDGLDTRTVLLGSSNGFLKDMLNSWLQK